MSKFIGDVSAYAYAVSKGYTGTEEEFAELMAAYSTVGQTAVDAAESALNSKTAAETAATTATNKASEATTAAQTATTKAGEASQSASQAHTSAQTASTKASEASQSATTATEKATEATTAADTATTAKNDAVSAKNAAETAQGKAEDAQEAAERVAESIPSDYSQLSEDVSELKSGLNILIEKNLEFVETATAGATNAYKQIANKLKVGTQYAFKVTSRTKGTYLFQAGIGQSASSMYDIGTYSIDAGETKTIIGYTTTNQNIKYFRLYSANVPLANMDWDVSIYTYFDAKENIEDLKASTNKTFENVVNAIQIELTKGQYYNTSGATVDINAPLTNNGWNSMVVDCAFRDIFTITGTGGSTPRLWVFADENGNILAKNTRATETNLEIIAPKNARYLVANFEASSPQLLLKGSSVSNRYAIEDYECRITTKQKVVVAKDSSGDYSSIQDAINSITDSSFTNQYEIVLKEGTYNEQNLILPKYTYLHGVGRNKPVITSEGLTEYVSVIDAQNTCRIANVKIVSATKYCLHEDVSLHGCTVICEDVDFEQLGTSNVTIIGNGVFENAKFIFMGCTFKGGQVFSHTNSTSYIGVTQHLVIKYCKFINAGIVLAVSGSVESNTMADCICEVVGCRGDGTTPLITCRVPSDNVYPWKIIGGSNINFSVTFDGETLTDVINTTDN